VGRQPDARRLCAAVYSQERPAIFAIADFADGDRAISFLALEAVGGAITLSYGTTNAIFAIIVASILLLIIGIPISRYAIKHGVDIDLLTRGAGFGYLGSTVTSLIYASFTFILFAIEASIMTGALELTFGIPLWLGYIISAVAVIPLVTHGVRLISTLPAADPAGLDRAQYPAVHLHRFSDWEKFDFWLALLARVINPANSARSRLSISPCSVQPPPSSWR
jgi:hypothetical protein